jgi:hypothetical protein
MKKLVLIISLLIALALLSACAAPMTVTPTIIAETTSTSIPTSIPPTATIEPSPTVDPNMPEAPNGETVTKDAQGNYTYMKTENGNQVMYTRTTIPELNNLQEWTRPGTIDSTGAIDSNGIYFLDKSYYPDLPQSTLLVTISFIDNNEQPGQFLYVNHPPAPSTVLPASFSSFLVAQLYERDRSSGIVPIDLLTGKFKPSITTVDGVPHQVNLDRMALIEVPWGPESDPKNHPEFHQNSDEEDSAIQYRWAVTVDSSNHVKGFFSTPNITKLTDAERAKMILSPLVEFIVYQTIPIYQIAPHLEPPVINFATESFRPALGPNFFTFVEK